MENIQIHLKLSNPSKEEDYLEQTWKTDNSNLTNLKTNEIFSFKSILDDNLTNEEIFNNQLKDSVNSSLTKGVNLSVFTYGQSNPNKINFIKSYENDNNGIIFPLFKEMFTYLNQDFKYEIKVC